MPEDDKQEHPLGPTEELLAKAEAEAAASTRQTEADRQDTNIQTQDNTFLETALEREKQQAEESDQRKQEEQEQKERETRENNETYSSRWLEAPQQEGILSHPTPDASPASPGKEQHEQALAEEAGGQGGGMKRTISTRTQLGAVVTLDGAYAVPRYQTVIKETPIQEKGGYTRQFAKEQGRGQQQAQERAKDRDIER